MRRNHISHERLLQVFHYCPETGLWTKLIKTGNKCKLGPQAFCPRGLYPSLRIDADTFRIHQLAWLYVHGTWPSGHIDHINGNKHDNRISNLRIVDRKTNSQNLRGPMRNNKLGFLGVIKENNKFRAQISKEGHNYRIGIYDTPEEAHSAYLTYKRILHGGCTI